MVLNEGLVAVGFTRENADKLAANAWFTTEATYTHQSMGQRIKDLAYDLKVTETKAQDIIAKWPPIIGMQAKVDGQPEHFRVTHRIKCLAEDLDVGIDALIGPKGKVTKWPQFLSYQIEGDNKQSYRIGLRLNGLVNDLRLEGVAKARKIVLSYPSILARQIRIGQGEGWRYTIEHRILDLTEDLGLDDDQIARKMIADYPVLVGCQKETIEEGKTRYRMTDRIRALMNDFRCDLKEVAEILRKQPNIIGLQQSENEYSLGRHITEGQDALSWIWFSSDESLDLMRRNPVVLTYTKRRLTYSARQLRRLERKGKYSQGEVKRLVNENPTVLYMSPYATETRNGKPEKISDLRAAYLRGSAEANEKVGLERLDVSTLKTAVDKTLSSNQPHDLDALKKTMRPPRKKISIL